MNSPSLKKLLLSAIILSVASFAIFQFDLIKYVYGQAKGQAKILYHAKPIDHFLDDEAFDEKLKEKIRLIQEIRTYAMDSLGLSNSKNYTTLYDQQGKDILWNVVACEPFALKSYQWKFPFLGSFGYKGHFKLENAQKERDLLDAQGYDTNIYPVSGWSTLGWFRDPILSNMLRRSEGQLADLIIHELTHATIFVHDNLRLNENIATFIGYEGAKAFLKEKYGEASTVYQRYIYQEADGRKYRDHMMRGANSLDSSYQAMSSLPLQMKDSLKSLKIMKIVATLDTVSFYDTTRFENIFKKSLPNNATFTSYLRYHSGREALEKDYFNEFDGNIQAYILYLKRKYNWLAVE